MYWHPSLRCLPPLHLTANDHFSHLAASIWHSLSFSLLISLPGSLREPAYAINVSWQHATSPPGPGELWGLHLLSGARWKHQSVCYATKANHTTRTIQHGGSVRELTQSLKNRGTSFFLFFSYKQRRTNQTWQRTFTWRPSGEDNPKYKYIC